MRKDRRDNKDNKDNRDDRDNDNMVENIVEKFEETSRRFLRLYERFTTEMLTISKQGETLGKIIEELKAESSLATEFKVQVRKGIKESVSKVTKEVDDQIKKSIQESVTEEINESIKEFKEVIEGSTEILRDYAVDRKLRNMWIYCGVFFCGFIFLFSMYTATTLRRHMPESFFTSSQVSTYRSGVRCENIWNRLSKKEQDRLLSIEEGLLPPEKNSYDWIRSKYPGLDRKGIRKKFKELNVSK